MNGVRFVISEVENLASGPETQLQAFRTLFGKSFITVKKRESFCHRHQKGADSVPLTGLVKTLYTFFSWLLTKERSYQTHFHNIHFKIIGLVRRFLLRRRNMSLSKIKLLFYNH